MSEWIYEGVYERSLEIANDAAEIASLIEEEDPAEASKRIEKLQKKLTSLTRELSEFEPVPSDVSEED